MTNFAPLAVLPTGLDAHTTNIAVDSTFGGITSRATITLAAMAIVSEHPATTLLTPTVQVGHIQCIVHGGKVDEIGGQIGEHSNGRREEFLFNQLGFVELAVIRVGYNEIGNFQFIVEMLFDPVLVEIGKEQNGWNDERFWWVFGI